MDETTSAQAAEFRKLQAPGGEFTFLLGGEPVTCWMRNLEGNEPIIVSAYWHESFNASIALGIDTKSAGVAAGLAVELATLQLCLRTKENGPPLFPDVRSVWALPSEVRNVIHAELIKRYELTENELGNSLRERIRTL